MSCIVGWVETSFVSCPSWSFCSWWALHSSWAEQTLCFTLWASLWSCWIVVRVSTWFTRNHTVNWPDTLRTVITIGARCRNNCWRITSTIHCCLCKFLSFIWVAIKETMCVLSDVKSKAWWTIVGIICLTWRAHALSAIFVTIGSDCTRSSWLNISSGPGYLHVGILSAIEAVFSSIARLHSGRGVRGAYRSRRTLLCTLVLSPLCYSCIRVLSEASQALEIISIMTEVSLGIFAVSSSFE